MKYDILQHICFRPKMYFGDTKTTSIELAAFLNGWMAHSTGLMAGGFEMKCQADMSKTPEENGRIFLDQIVEWFIANTGWRCCIDTSVRSDPKCPSCNDQAPNGCNYCN